VYFHLLLIEDVHHFSWLIFGTILLAIHAAATHSPTVLKQPPSEGVFDSYAAYIANAAAPAPTVAPWRYYNLFYQRQQDEAETRARRPLLPERTKRFKFQPKQNEDEYEESDMEEDSPAGSESSSSSSVDSRAQEMKEKGWLPFFPSTTGDVVTWGKGRDGQRGSVKLVDSDRALALSSLSNRGITDVVCGLNFTIARTSNGYCYSWGSSPFALGHRAVAQQPTPRRIEALSDVNVRKIAAGDNFVAVLTDAGRVFTWGEGSCGQLGHDDHRSNTDPRAVQPLSKVQIVDIFCGPDFMFALSNFDAVYAWGNAELGQLGLTAFHATECVPKPVDALLGLGVKQIACGKSHAAALVTAGVYRWGQLELKPGISVTNRIPEKYEALPEIISTDRKVVSIACGDNHLLILIDNGDVFALGSNAHGQLGFSASEKFASSASRVLLESSCSAIFARHNYSVAVSSAGEVFEWGSRGTGVSRTSHAAPHVVAGLNTLRVRSLAGGLGHTAAIASKLTQVGGDFADLLRSGLLHDLVLVAIDGTKFPVHSVVIASRSERLQQLVSVVLTTDPSPLPELPLKVETGEIMSLLLQFLYSDYVQSSSTPGETWIKLKDVANTYGLERLQAMCLAFSQPELASSDMRRTHYAPPPSLEADMRRLINSKMFSDTTFRILEEDGSAPTIPAHRCVLAARSPYFKMMFGSGMSEAQKGGVIEISDTPAVVFLAILEYLYSSAISLDPTYVVDLFVASHKYRISALKQQCEVFVSDNLDTENVLSLLEISTLYDSPTLRAACKDFIRSHYKDVVASSEFVTLSPDIAYEVQTLEPEEQRKPAVPVSYNIYNRALQETKQIYSSGLDMDEEDYEEDFDSEEEEYRTPLPHPFYPLLALTEYFSCSSARDIKRYVFQTKLIIYLNLQYTYTNHCMLAKIRRRHFDLRRNHSVADTAEVAFAEDIAVGIGWGIEVGSPVAAVAAWGRHLVVARSL
jgi:alpha-tubulin suppressor-like RCC1 family protein